jgi:hypothetical protein
MKNWGLSNRMSGYVPRSSGSMPHSIGFVQLLTAVAFSVIWWRQGGAINKLIVITLLVYNVLVVGHMTSSYLFSERAIFFPDVDKVCDVLYRLLYKWIFTSEKLYSKFQEDKCS